MCLAGDPSGESIGMSDNFSPDDQLPDGDGPAFPPRAIKPVDGRPLIDGFEDDDGERLDKVLDDVILDEGE